MTKEDLYSNAPIIKEDGNDDSWQDTEVQRGMDLALAETAFEVGHDLLLEEEHYKENTKDIEKRIESIKLRMKKIEEALVTVQTAYEKAEPGERAGFRSMVASGKYALQRAEQDLRETLEVLGEIDLD